MDNLSPLLRKDQQIKIEEEQHSFIAHVESVETGLFQVRLEEEHQGSLVTKIGSKVRGIFLSEDSVCSFQSQVLKREVSPPRLFLSWPKNVALEKIVCCQRSGFTGVEGHIPFRYESLAKGLQEIKFVKQGTATWIGGDEMVMVSVVEIPRGTNLALEIGRPISPVPLRLFAKVYKVKQHGSLFTIRLVFQAISERDRDVILKYCLQKQAQVNKSTTPVNRTGT